MLQTTLEPQGAAAYGDLKLNLNSAKCQPGLSTRRHHLTVETDQIMNPLKSDRSEVRSARRLFSISVNIRPVPATGRPIKEIAGTPTNGLSGSVLIFNS